MTKQEEIREGMQQLIAFYMLGDYWDDLTLEQKDLVGICTDHIQARESDIGVVIKVDRELPDRDFARKQLNEGKPLQYNPYYVAQLDMMRAGYTAWEPLMGVVK